MFQSSKKLLRAWVAFADDVLGGPPADAHVGQEAWATHPHRRPLRWQRERRAGMVAPAPAHCLCPVRPSPRHGERGEVLPNRR